MNRPSIFPLYLISTSVDIPEIIGGVFDYLVTKELYEIIMSKVTIENSQNYIKLKYSVDSIFYAKNSKGVCGRLHVWKVNSINDVFNILRLHYLTFRVPSEEIKNHISKIFFLEPWEILR